MSAPAVTAVERLLDILEVFQARRQPLSLSALAQATGIPKSSCHAMVGTLIARGYLYTGARPRALYPTRRLYDLARAIQAQDPFVEHARPVLERLREGTGETVIFGKRQGDAALYLEVLEGRHSIRYSAHAGDFKPLHSSAIGKALIGSMKESELRESLRGRPLAAATAATLTDEDALLADLLQSRRRGYFLTRGENVPDVWAVSAFFSFQGETVAVAVAGPRNRMEDAVIAWAHELLAACSQLARQ